MKLVCDGTAENGVSMTVEHLQSAYGIVYLHFAGTIQIHVKNELDFIITLPAGTLNLTGTCVELHTAASPQRQIRFDGAAGCGLLGNIIFTKRA
jgi:hypothetical protein